MNYAVPAAIRRQLQRGQPVELDWGIVLRPPTDPSSAGAAGAYRWDYYDPPLRDDGTRGARAGSSARDLTTAWVKATAKAAELEARMLAQATGHRLDMRFGELAEHYPEPARHPEWNGTSHARKVRSVTANWLLDEGITVIVPSAVGSAGGGTAPAVPLRDVQLRDLTASILIEALHHVREARAYGTYRTAHECVTAIVAWAVKQRWAPPGWLDTRDVKRLADPRSSARRTGQGRHVAPVPKDDIVPVDEVLRLRSNAEQLGSERDALLLDLLAFAGPRIGEALALHASRWWRDEDGSGWFDIEERADRTSKRQLPPRTASTERCGYRPGWQTTWTRSVRARRAGVSPRPTAAHGRWIAGGYGDSTAGPKLPPGSRVRTTATTRCSLHRTTRRTAREGGRTDAGGGGASTPGATMPPAISCSSSGSTPRTSPATWGIATATPAGSCMSAHDLAANYASQAQQARPATRGTSSTPHPRPRPWR